MEVWKPGFGQVLPMREKIHPSSELVMPKPNVPLWREKIVGAEEHRFAWLCKRQAMAAGEASGIHRLDAADLVATIVYPRNPEALGSAC